MSKHEDTHVLAFHVAGMMTVVKIINMLSAADLVLSITYNPSGYWVVCKDDSRLVQGLAEVFPKLDVIR